MLGTFLLVAFLFFLAVVCSALALASRADDAIERRNHPPKEG